MSKVTKRMLAETYKRLADSTRLPMPPAARPTHDQVVAAAWGNVAAENPKVTLSDAKRAIKKV